MIKKSVTLFVVLFSIFAAVAQDKKYKVHTIAFYNCENLFDTTNDPEINDEEWLPTSTTNWTLEKYHKKLQNLSKVISDIGTANNPNTPTILGVAEVENRGVLEDLVKEPALAGKNYGIIHFDSPDKRGIDVGLLYQKQYFVPTSYKNIPLIIYKDSAKGKVKKDEEKTDDKMEADDSGRVFTRDQLLVTGLLEGEEINIIVNHWPSRSGGEKRSSPFREAAAALNKKIIDSLYSINPNAKIITMGDLNDGPYNKSVKKVLGAKAKKEDVSKQGLYNPMEEMADRGIGTLAYRDAWDLFDQIIISEPFIRKDYSSFSFWKAGVFNKSYLMQDSGRYKGYPKRNWNGVPGYSDHFPSYIYLIKEM
ncbi:endonuclease/exonuclease/phosphatase family protein [Flavobacterium arcticum]|uniref:Endonuclease/exonuclease/phosphatase family protein n=1 Tax=Flavobacterium arcticum TaxID=1784713 RepID=A0A345HBC8_9FLAO|nr:endonuclease/exonuclease/phosphatase family protein [Flavobacterium arcticum]AXG73888.1 endonuclease/exonuclease/phosphatase family protein [Flavobacterium arcticum]KAF2508864.1 endonuclease/exonuclease/phosphatase family protein [Flavobacterium arcticum]